MSASLSFPISKTKILPPHRRAEIITRPRLIETLHALLNKKLTIISAPAGYGKTSLLIDLVEKSEIPICWLSLDILDQEPQRFLSYLVACIREKFPSFGVETLAVLNNTASIQKENERLAVICTNDIYQGIFEHFAIVLDDYQFIEQVPEIRAFINRFIQLAGEHCHLILSSRILPTLADLHLLVARDQVGGLSFEHLAFLPEEIQALFTQNSGRSLTVEQAEDLARKTDGWITSISLPGLSLDPSAVQLKAPLARTGMDLYNYFSHEVLDKQTGPVREFLLLTSLFDEVDLGVCGPVLKGLFPERPNDWKALFDHVQKNNLFVIPAGADGLTFRYHHLFQEFLQARLQAETPGLITVVMTRLAAHYWSQHEWEKAHYIYENLNDQTSLVALIAEAGTHFIRNGRVATLGNWLDRLPVFVLQDSPVLLSLQGAVAHIRGETQTGLALLAQAEKGLRAAGDEENLAVTLNRSAAAYREAGDYNRSLSAAEETISLTSASESPVSRFNLAAAQRARGLALFRLGRTVEALEWLEKSLRLFNRLQDRDYVPILEMELGMTQHALGSYELAIKYYLSALKRWEATGNLGWQASLKNNLGVLYHYLGEYEKAFRVFESGIDCSRRSGYVRTQALNLCSLGDLLIDLRENARARECFEQASGLAYQGGHSFLALYASIARIRIARLENQLERASALAQALLVQLEQNPSPGDEATFRMEYGCLLLALEKPTLAAGELARSADLFTWDGHTLEANICRLWLAAALTASGLLEEAFVQLRALVCSTTELAEPAPLYIAAGQARPWFEGISLPADVAETTRRLFEGADHFSKSIPAMRRRLRQATGSLMISAPRLTIQAFGPAQVCLNGRKLLLSDWQTRETRELFFYFLHSGPQTKEDLGLVFWPDISPARLKMRFKTNMYRLRHAVGQNTILFLDEHYLFNPELDYDHDVENFHKCLENAAGAATPAERRTYLQAAVDLVTGPYLADIDSEWAAQERARIEKLYHAALASLARLYLDGHQAAEALTVCETALASDPLMEEAYRLSMLAHAMLGDGPAVSRVYQACCAVLEDELGVSPSAETKKLYKNLI